MRQSGIHAIKHFYDAAEKAHKETESTDIHARVSRKLAALIAGELEFPRRLPEEASPLLSPAEKVTRTHILIDDSFADDEIEIEGLK